MIELKGKYGEAVIMTDNVEPDAVGQIIAFLNDPCFANQIRIMPDVHSGKGAVIGFTMPMSNSVIPNVIGVDLSCGVRTVLFKCERSFVEGLRTPEFDKRVRNLIRFGNAVYSKPKVNIEREFPWAVMNKHIVKLTMALNERLGEKFYAPLLSFDYFNKLCKKIGEDPWYAQCSCGSLGGGNHYIEVGYNDASSLGYISVHSGSRHLGLKTATYWQNMAMEQAQKRTTTDYLEQMEVIKKLYPQNEWQLRIADIRVGNKTTSGLEYLTGKDLFNYMWDSLVCHYFALKSREWMTDAMIGLIKPTWPLEEIIDTIHNYINMDDLVIRKGAVSAREGELLTIPLNMEDGILVCRGKGNPDWNFSAPHGAGRLYSRNKAKAILNEGEIAARMKEKGIYASALPKDELRDAYKPADEIISSIGPTVDIIHHMLPLVNFKSK